MFDVSTMVELDPGFEALTVEQRALLVLHYEVGLTVPEIAVVLAIPGGTVKSRIHAAIRRLRQGIETGAVR